MENHVDHAETPAELPPQPEPRRKPTALDLALGAIVAALVAGCVVVGAILAFELNPAGPVVVVVAAICAGSFSVRRLADYALKAAAVGLVVGGIVATLFWPFFDVS